MFLYTFNDLSLIYSGTLCSILIDFFKCLPQALVINSTWIRYILHAIRDIKVNKRHFSSLTEGHLGQKVSDLLKECILVRMLSVGCLIFTSCSRVGMTTMAHRVFGCCCLECVPSCGLSVSSVMLVMSVM